MFVHADWLLQEAWVMSYILPEDHTWVKKKYKIFKTVWQITGI